MKVLFVCTGNTCRSPMAAALLGDFFKRANVDAETSSAGVCAEDGETNPLAIAALKKAGLDVAPSKARQVDEAIIRGADIVIAMTSAQAAALKKLCAAGNIFSIRDIAGVDVPDPYGGGEQAYDSCLEELVALTPQIAEFITKRV